MEARPVLNYDILHLIMSISATQEVCSLMCTCWLLYREGAKFLLHHVKLEDDRGIQSFTQFMAADPYRRIPYLHSLDLSCGTLTPETAVLLRVFLGLAGPFLQLHHVLLRKPEDLLRSDPGLVEAFARTYFISFLAFYQPGALSFGLLERMSGVVHSASLHFDRSPTELPEKSNPIFAFRSLRNTLVEVSGHLFTADVTSSYTSGIVFPHVRRLRLETSTPIHTIDYARAFPNLASLYFSCRPEFYISVDEEERDDLAVARERNCTAMREHGGWSKLQFVDGAMADLWTLGLRSTIAKLKVLMLPLHEEHRLMAASMFEDLLRDNHIEKLHLNVWTPEATRNALRALSRASRDVQHLSLCIQLDEEDSVVGVTEMLVRAPSTSCMPSCSTSLTAT